MKFAMVLGSLAGGFLGDWVEKRSPTKGRIALLQIYALLFSSLSALQFLVDWKYHAVDAEIALVTSAIFPIGFAGCVLPMLANVVPPQLRSASFAVMASLCQGLSLAAVSTVIGNLSERFGLNTALFFASSIPYIMIVIVCLGLYIHYPKEATTN